MNIFLDLFHMTRSSRLTVHSIKSVSGGVKFRIKTRAIVPRCLTADGLLSGNAQSKSEVSVSPTESGNTSKSRTAANITAQTEGEVIEEAKPKEIRLDVTVVFEMTARGGRADQAQQVGNECCA